MENDWKLLTIFIGANDVCRSCQNDNETSPDYYEKVFFKKKKKNIFLLNFFILQTLETIIEKVYLQLPNTFVSIIQLFNISQVWNISQTSDYCIFMWDTFCNFLYISFFKKYLYLFR